MELSRRDLHSWLMRIEPQRWSESLATLTEVLRPRERAEKKGNIFMSSSLTPQTHVQSLKGGCKWCSPTLSFPLTLFNHPWHSFHRSFHSPEPTRVATFLPRTFQKVSFPCSVLFAVLESLSLFPDTIFIIFFLSAILSAALSCRYPLRPPWACWRGPESCKGG